MPKAVLVLITAAAVGALLMMSWHVGGMVDRRVNPPAKKVHDPFANLFP